MKKKIVCGLLAGACVISLTGCQMPWGEEECNNYMVVADSYGSYVIANEDGTKEIEGVEDISDFRNGVAVAINEDDDEALINTRGKEIVDYGEYMDILPLGYTGFFRAEGDDGCVVLTGKGKELFDANGYEGIDYDEYRDEDNFYVSHGVFVGLEEEMGSEGDFYTADGDLLVENCEYEGFGYDSILPADKNCGIIYIEIDGDDGNYIDIYSEKSKKLIFDGSDYASVTYGSGVIEAKEDDGDIKVFVINDKGTECYELEGGADSGVMNATSIEGVRCVQTEDETVVYNAKGKMEHMFTDPTSAYPVGDTIYYVSRDDDDYCVFNSKFKEVVEINNADLVYVLDAGIIAVDDDELSYYTLKGKLKYENCEMVEDSFSSGVFITEKGKIYCYAGEELFKMEEELSCYIALDEEHFIFTEDDEYYLVNNKGKILLEAEDEMTPYRTYRLIEADGFYYNYDGKEICEVDD